MTKPLEGKKYRITVISTYEGRFDSDEEAIEESKDILVYEHNSKNFKKASILRVDRYNGNKPATRIIPEPSKDGLLAIEELCEYVQDTERPIDNLEADSPMQLASKIYNQFLKKI